MRKSFQYGSRQIDYDLQFVKRKTLGISVDPHMRVLIKAPENAAIEKINSILIKKAPWIIKQQSFFLSFLPKMPPRKYVNGETHLYLGRQYQLKVENGIANKLNFTSRYMVVTKKQKSITARIVKQWYKERSKIKFAEIAKPLIENFAKYGVKPSNLYIQNMPTRWGSCTSTAKIILNPELLQAPKGCIEYVIIHELCHLVYRNHTKKFFELQEKEMPEWKIWKTKLDKLLA